MGQIQTRPPHFADRAAASRIRASLCPEEIMQKVVWSETGFFRSSSSSRSKGLGFNARETLAIGPKAAWLTGTDHFVNLVEMNGMWGCDALIRLAAMMEEAFLHAGDPRDVLPRKGFGCESCI